MLVGSLMLNSQKGGEKKQKMDLHDRLKAYIMVYNEAKREVGPEAAAVIVDQLGKDDRVAKMQAEKAGSGFPLGQQGPGQRQGQEGQGGKNVLYGDEPATDKQLEFLQRLNVQVDKPLTRQKASELIDQARAR